MVSVVLSALCPPASKANADTRNNSLTFTGSRETGNTTRLPDHLYRIAFLALKVMCACFTSELCCEWGRMARIVRELGRRNEAAHHLWDFLQHVVTHRTPLYLLLQPFIVHKLSQQPIGDHERHMQWLVRERVRGMKLPAARARGALLADLARELRAVRDDHDHYKFEKIAENIGTGGKRGGDARGTAAGVDKQQQHRPSLISMLVGRAPPRTPDHPAPLSAQRESPSSSSTSSPPVPPYDAGASRRLSDNGIAKGMYGADQKASSSSTSFASTQTKLRFMSSVEFKLNSGETSQTPLSPLSAGESCSDAADERPRLQRAHGPSMKTFKFRRSRNTRPDSTKAIPMSKDEKMLLVELVASNAIINNKATNATNNKLKEQAWQTITLEFNSSVSSFPRTASQLRLKWENLKKSARKRCANMRSSRIKTGGGKDFFPPDEVLDKVESLLGNTCKGFSVEFGGDATPNFQLENNTECESYNLAIELGDTNDNGEPPILSVSEVINPINAISTPPPPNNYLSQASGSGYSAKRKLRMEEEKCKARNFRENALAEYLTAKKKKIDLENEEKEAELSAKKKKLQLENDEKEIVIAKLKLELENAQLENLKLKRDLNLI